MIHEKGERSPVTFSNEGMGCPYTPLGNIII
jgi:hypothetical protein